MTTHRWPIARFTMVTGGIPTAEWRVARPVYSTGGAPCWQECPAQGKIPQILALVKDGDFEAAWRVLVEENPFPGILGRVCYNPCETACNRGEYDEAVSIRNVERFLGDYAASHDLRPTHLTEERKLNKVAVIGSGPAGLACAYQLTRRGYPVTVFEALPVAGGMLWLGIPAYRLPRDVMAREVRAIQELGVEIRLGTCVGQDISLAELHREYVAIFVAIGASKPQPLAIPGAEASNVYPGISYLSASNRGEPATASKVVVIGGGNTAIDCARTARRLGAKEVHLACLESRSQMPAHPWTIQEAEEEGVVIHTNWSPKTIMTRHGRARGVTFAQVNFRGFGPDGRPDMDEVPHSRHVVEADAVVIAVGQGPDFAGLEDLLAERNIPVLGESCVPGVFVGGDAVPGCGSVVRAVGQGTQAALSIDAYLRGETLMQQEALKVVDYEDLNVNYYCPIGRNPSSQLPLEQRATTFQETVLGYDEPIARAEAQRCFICGTCFQCDNCWLLCPDMAVVKVQDQQYHFEYDYCKGCGICAWECPCGSITMMPETGTRDIP
jgi:2-oxoacid:acceptor oxidoreductase delta subunit (pyruvate/2-ketoisovalerate family)